jgi:hypothetical protein
MGVIFQVHRKSEAVAAPSMVGSCLFLLSGWHGAFAAAFPEKGWGND